MCQIDLQQPCILHAGTQHRIARDSEPDWHWMKYVMTCEGGSYASGFTYDLPICLVLGK